MRIERVEVLGFRSFRDLEVFDFTSTPGVVKFSGRNEDEPELGANGAGKSSLWEAVYWCLHGKTSTGLRGPEVSTWTAGTGVYVLVRIAGRVLVRTWSGKEIASLKLDGEEVTQDEVIAWVGLDAHQMLHCSYMAQHTASFLDLGAQAKTDLLASVLQLDQWSDRAKSAKERASSIERDLHALAVEASKLQGELETLERVDYAASRKQWEGERTKRLDDYRMTLATARKASLPSLDELARHADLLARMQVARDRLNECMRVTTRAADRLQAIKAAVKATKCPTCGRAWDKHTGERPSDESLQDALAARDDARSAEDEADVVAKEAERRFRAIDEEHKRLATLADAARRAHKETLAALTLEEERVNPFDEMEAQARKSIAVARQRFASKQEEVQLLEASLKRVEYWVNGFKDVRLFLVAEALTHLEVEVNSALMQLGLREWRIRFAPDSETKKGDIKRGFSVLIESPNNQRPVPWAVWSGGEAQRLRVATAMGISNLISAYTGFVPFVEVWDEPSTGMSLEGITALLEAFDQRARHEGRQVWVVDHRALEAGAFSETVTAVKQSGTTRLERESITQGE